MVRGGVARFTLLDRFGTPVQGDSSVIVTKGLSQVMINEISDSRGNDLRRSDFDKPRVLLRGKTNTIAYSADISLVGVDPDLLWMLTGQPRVENAAGDVVGNDATLRLPVSNFSMEIWTRLAVPVDGYRYGYTLFPRMRGGRVSGFAFSGGAVNFRVTGSRTARNARWGFGPFDLRWDGDAWSCLTDTPSTTLLGFGAGSFGMMPFGDSEMGSRVEYTRLGSEVSRNVHWKNFLLSQAPQPQCGAQPLYDVIDNFFADPASQTVDVLDGGTSGSTSDDVVDGGRA